MKKSIFVLLALLGLTQQLSADLVEGKCGDGVLYKYDTDTRKMIVYGNGPMFDYDQDKTGPFYTLAHHMQSLVIEHGVTHIGNGAFRGCYALGGHLELPLSVTSIGDEAFSGCCYLTKLAIGPSVVTIGDYAFQSCWALEGELVLPNCLETIGDGAFNGCKKLSGDLLIPNSVKSIGNNAFVGCEGFAGQLLLGSSLATIGEHAFSGGLNFTGNLFIPKSVTNIGRSAFDGCKYLVGEVVVPEGVTTIEDCVFRDCSGITGITLLGQVTRIRNSAFNRCSALTNFVCYATTPPDATEYHVFDNIPLKTVYVPAEAVELYKTTIVWKDFEILPVGGSGVEGVLNDNKVHISLQEGKLIVKSGNGCIKDIALMGINGVEIFSEDSSSSSIELNMSSFPSGVYLVKVNTDAGEYYHKIIW